MLLSLPTGFPKSLILQSRNNGVTALVNSILQMMAVVAWKQIQLLQTVAGSREQHIFYCQKIRSLKIFQGQSLLPDLQCTN